MLWGPHSKSSCTNGGMVTKQCLCLPLSKQRLVNHHIRWRMSSSPSGNTECAAVSSSTRIMISAVTIAPHRSLETACSRDVHLSYEREALNLVESNTTASYYFYWHGWVMLFFELIKKP